MLSRCPFPQEWELLNSPTVPNPSSSANPASSTNGARSSSAHRRDPQTAQDFPGLPGYSLGNTARLITFLEQDLLTPDLDRMAPSLWLMSTQSSANINPLHKQLVKGRQVIVSEDPRLHLVWRQDRVFVKPLPPYLMSYSFWTDILLSDPPVLGHKQQRIAAAALGYLRTYYYLLQHESDLRVAQKEHTLLVPLSIRWENICRFRGGFDGILDSDVSPRYHYGELRLSRLNFYAKIFLRKFHYERIHTQYGTYFSQYYGPLLFVFGMFSLALNALQVELTAEQLRRSTEFTMGGFGRCFSIGTLAWLALICFSLVLVFLYMFIDEWQYAIRHRVKLGPRIEDHKKLSAAP